MNKYIEGFSEFQKGYGISKFKVEKDRCILSMFFRWLGDTDIKDVDKKKIVSYRSYLKNRKSTLTKRNLSKATIRLYMTVVKSLFEYLFRYEMILSNPVEGLKIKEDSIPVFRSIFTVKDINLFLNSISTDTVNGKRDRAIFELMYSSGLRVSDIMRLEIDHLNIDGRILVVRGKGNKDRYVPFSETARKHLIIYLNESRKEYLKTVRKNDDRQFVFLSTYNRMKYMRLRNTFERYMKKCDLKGKGYTMHSIRHATGTHLLSNGASVRYVQELLGHEDLNTTQLYTRPTVDNIKAVYRTYHPRENEYYRDVDDKYIEEVMLLKKQIIKGRKKNIYYRKHGTTRGFSG